MSVQAPSDEVENAADYDYVGSDASDDDVEYPDGLAEGVDVHSDDGMMEEDEKETSLQDGYDEEGNYVKKEAKEIDVAEHVDNVQQEIESSRRKGLEQQYNIIRRVVSSTILVFPTFRR